MSDLTTTLMHKGDCSRTFAGNMSSSLLQAAQTGAAGNKITIINLDEGVSRSLIPGDSTYTETYFAELIDTSIPIVGDQQSLDSALYPVPDKKPWEIVSFTKQASAIFGFRCMVIRSSAVSKDTAQGKEKIASCELWVVDDDEYLEEIVSYQTKISQLSGLSPHYQLDMYSEIMSQYAVTFTDLGVDTIVGNPVKVDLSVEVVLSQDDAAELAMVFGDSLPDSMPVTTENMRTTIRDHFRNNIKPGSMDLIHLTYEIIDIDTTTVLPDSLFEIPAEFTKR